MPDEAARVRNLRRRARASTRVGRAAMPHLIIEHHDAASAPQFRRLLIRWEKKARNYLAMLHFACAIITWNQCLFG